MSLLGFPPPGNNGMPLLDGSPYVPTLSCWLPFAGWKLYLEIFVQILVCTDACNPQQLENKKVGYESYLYYLSRI